MGAEGQPTAERGADEDVTVDRTTIDVRPVILVADDDLDILRFIEVNLRAQGHRVVTAADGDRALALALDLKPALALVDVILPGVDGYEVCRRLRSDWRFGDPSVILLTDRSLPVDRTLGLAAGADDFIVKPFDPVELVSRVNITLQRLEQVRSSSPLTGLPGNVQIQRELEMRVAAGEEVALLYADLDDFKAYNDHYGFLQGDDAIRMLADVIRQAAEGRPDTFLGHVGGDDFIVLAHPDVVEGLVHDVIGGFESRVGSLYEPEDAERGYIEIDDRQGRKRRFSLLSLSIGVATNLGRTIEDYRELVDVATEMKEYAKRKPGNAVAVDRRAGGELAARLVGLAPAGPRRGARRGRIVRGYLVNALVTVLALALVVGPATIVLAENARPDQPLWRVKLGIERVRLALERDPAREVALHLEFAARRVGELGPLIAEDGGPVDAVIDNLRWHTGAAVRAVEAVDDPQQAQLARTNAAGVLRHQVDVLGALVVERCESDLPDPPPGCAGLRQALEASQAGLGAVGGEGGSGSSQGQSASARGAIRAKGQPKVDPRDRRSARGVARGRSKDAGPPVEKSQRERDEDKGQPGRPDEKPHPGEGSEKE